MILVLGRPGPDGNAHSVPPNMGRGLPTMGRGLPTVAQARSAAHRGQVKDFVAKYPYFHCTGVSVYSVNPISIFFELLRDRTDTTVFAQNTTVFAKSTTVFAQNIIVFAQNTNVFAQNTPVFAQNTTVHKYSSTLVP